MTRATYTEMYIDELSQIAKSLDVAAIERAVALLRGVRANGGRLFILGVGGGAGHAGHAVNDFRKIAGFEAYAPTDNVSELTARVNDEGWETTFVRWLETSRLDSRDAVLVFSVGGGDEQRNISPNIVEALRLCQSRQAGIIGIVGRDGGFTGRTADVCIRVPVVNSETITPHTEAFQAVVWHLIVSHPALRQNPMKWESVR
jgi:D-sedoheptulose 7-phosphate isomerase